MENKRKRPIDDVAGDDNSHIQKKLKVVENPYDADDEDSSSGSESHMDYILAAADYFAPEVDEFVCDSGYMLENLYDNNTSPKIANIENSPVVGDLYPKLNVKERLAAVPFEKISPVIDLTSTDDEPSECESAVRTLVSLLEEVEKTNEHSNTIRVQYESSPKTNILYNNSTSSPKIANSENSPMVGDLYPKLNVKERLAAVPIKKFSPVIDLTSTDDEPSECESAVRTLVSLLEEVEKTNEHSNTIRVQYESSPKTNILYNNSTSSPKIANSENSPMVGDLYPKLNVEERLATVPIEKFSPVIDLTSTDDESSVKESAVTTLVSLPEEAD